MQGGQARHFQPGPMKLGYDGGCTGGRSGVYLHRDALGPFLVWQLGVPGTLLGPLMTAGGPASYIFISPRSSISPRYLFTGFAFRRR